MDKATVPPQHYTGLNKAKAYHFEPFLYAHTEFLFFRVLFFIFVVQLPLNKYIIIF